MMKFFSLRSSVALFGVLVLLTTLSFAQATKGVIAGTVSDKSGAVVTGATVTAAAKQGGETRSTTTGDNGDYRIESLSPGSYIVTATSPNFTTAKVDNVEVNTSLITSVNIKLEVGGGTESITVEATAAQVQTESGDLAKTIPNRPVEDLPIVSGNPYQLATILPGVTTLASREDFANGTSFAVNGLRPRANNFLIDGFDNNDNGIAGQALQPTNQEAVQEVTVLTNAYSAEFGRGGASVSNLTFRSGTNEIHGAVWDEYSGAALDALTSEEGRQGVTRVSQFVQNRFGFRVGAPIVKDKLFAFGSTQWTRFFGAFQGAPLILPTSDGVASLQAALADPAVVDSNVNLLIDSMGGLRGSTADPSQVGNINIGNRAGCGSPCLIEVGPFTRFETAASPAYQWVVKVDYIASDRDTFNVRFISTRTSLSPDLFANPGALPTMDTEQGGPARNFGAFWTHSFSPRVLNELRFSAQTIDARFGPTAATAANSNANLPGLALAGSFGFSVAWGGFEQGTFPQFRGHKVFQFQDAVAINKGSHSFKLGADISHLEINDGIPFNFNGLITYSAGGDCSAIGLGTCTDLANYVDDFSGPAGTITRQFGNPRVNVPTTIQAYYFQDTWKVKSNLTLNYGIRYEYHPPDYHNVLAFPSVRRATVLTDPFNQRFEAQRDRNNFAPRVGFSWSPRFWPGLFGDGKTVIRAGYGLYYDALFTNINNNTAGTTPNTLGGTINGGPLSRGTADAFIAVNNITPTASPLDTVFSVPDDIVNPVTHQWNFNVQRELPGKFIAEVAYVGTRGQRLLVSEQLNPRTFAGLFNPPGPRLNPARGSIVIRGNRGDSIYHGLQTSVRRSYGGLFLQGSYTWSRAIDNMSEIFATSGGASRWQDVDDPRSDRGPAAFHRKHRGVISWVYDVPYPKANGGGMKVLSALARDWTLSGQISFQSGAPETIFFGGFDFNGDGEAFNDRPDQGNLAAPINYDPDCISGAIANCITGIGLDLGGGVLVDINNFNPGVASDFRYIFRSDGQNGNVTRNSIYGPGRQDYNLSVQRRIKLTERHGLEFRADFINAFNHPNDGVVAISGDVASPLFLDVTATRSGGRTLRLWLKYQF